MDLIGIFTFTIVAALLVISPGPNGLLIAKTVPISGQKAGFANIWGFMAAFYVHGSLSILGISVLLVQSAEAFQLFKILGATYLCWIGIKSLYAAWKNVPASVPVKSESSRQVSLQSAFFEGFLTNVLNPKVSMFYLAAFPQFLPLEQSASQGFLLVSVHALVNFMWFSAMVLLLARLQGLAKSGGFTRWLQSITGLVFVGFGAKLALLRPLEES